MYQNKKHKPHLPDKRQHIKRSGRTVVIAQLLLLQGSSNTRNLMKETSRVIIPCADGNPFLSLALAMTCSMGDYDGRFNGHGKLPVQYEVHCPMQHVQGYSRSY
jgi:hypothetical protein